MCRRYRPQPIEVEWLTTRPTTNQPPPSSYFDSNERYYQGKHGHQAQQMDANLEPETDVGFGVGKKPTTDYTKDDVIILDSMGCSFGTTDNPIVIDDDKSSKKETGTFRTLRIVSSSIFFVC